MLLLVKSKKRFKTKRAIPTRRGYSSVIQTLNDSNASSRLDNPYIQKDNSLVLSKRDSRFFMSVMKNPPEPTQDLLSLFE